MSEISLQRQYLLLATVIQICNHNKDNDVPQFVILLLILKLVLLFDVQF